MVLQKSLNQNALHFSPQIPSPFQLCHLHDAEKHFFPVYIQKLHETKGDQIKPSHFDSEKYEP